MAHRHQIIFIPAPLFPVLSSDVLFWATQLSEEVDRVDVDGISNPATWASGGLSAGCAVDEEIQKVLWTIYSNDAIRSSDWDGSNTVTLTLASGVPWGCDTDATWVYYCAAGNARIRKADKSDGSGDANVKTAVGNNPRGIQVDIEAQIIYFGLRNGGAVKRVDTDGANLLFLRSGAGFVFSIDVDPDNEHCYYVERSTEEIRRIDYDGSNDTLIYDNVGSTMDGMCIDLEAGHIFWADVLDDSIGRVDLDGSNPIVRYRHIASIEPNEIDLRYPQDSYYAKPHR